MKNCFYITSSKLFLPFLSKRNLQENKIQVVLYYIRDRQKFINTLIEPPASQFLVNIPKFLARYMLVLVIIGLYNIQNIIFRRK